MINPSKLFNKWSALNPHEVLDELLVGRGTIFYLARDSVNSRQYDETFPEEIVPIEYLRYELVEFMIEYNNFLIKPLKRPHYYRKKKYKKVRRK